MTNLSFVRSFFLLASSVALSISPLVSAEDADDERGDDAIFYSSAGVEKISIDFDNLDSPINIKGSGGVTFPGLEWIGAEIGASITLIPGKNSGGGNPIFGGGGGTPCTGTDPLLGTPTPAGCDPNAGSGGGNAPANNSATSDDAQLFSLGIFLVGRTPGKVYATGKVGFQFLQSNIEEVTDADDSTGVAYGVGAGYRYGRGNGGIELSYNKYSDLVDGIALSFTYDFSTTAQRRRDKGGRNRDD